MFLQQTFVSIGRSLPAVIAPAVITDLKLAPAWVGIYFGISATASLVTQLGCGSFIVRYGAIGADVMDAAPALKVISKHGTGTDTIDNLPEIVSRVENGERHIVYAEFDKSMDYSTETKVLGAKAQAFVNIMKGCDKYCSYCIVPFTRGKEKSRTIDEVLADMARLVATGVREITLLGQNVNAWTDADGRGLDALGSVQDENVPPVERHPRLFEHLHPALARCVEQESIEPPTLRHPHNGLLRAQDQQPSRAARRSPQDQSAV